MSNTTRTRPAEQQLPPQAQTQGQAVAIKVEPPRLPYHPRASSYGVDPVLWETLVNAIYPAARTTEGVLLAIAYCKARNLDIMKRPVHIVPMYTKKKTPDGKEVSVTIETIWPGISEVRTTAFRTGVYAGCDPAEFGPTIKKTWEIEAKSNNDDGHPFAPQNEKPSDAKKIVKTVTVEFPEWSQVTVYRMVGGQRCAFPGPRVYWLESYATVSRWNDAPNQMWEERATGQLEKCAEAAALRKAFPEELGGEYIVDEANRRMVDVTPVKELPPARPEREPETSTRSGQVSTDQQQRVNKPEEPEQQHGHDPETGEVTMSDALEGALAGVTKLWDVAEIEGVRAALKKELSADEYQVWQRAALEQERRIKSNR